MASFSAAELDYLLGERRPPPQVGRVHKGADLRREDEPLVPVEVAETLYLLQLAIKVPSECLRRRLCEAHRPPALLRLRLAYRQAATVASERAPHPHLAACQVDVSPRQSQEFPLPHPRCDGQDVQGVQLVVARGLQKSRRPRAGASPSGRAWGH